MSNNTNSTTDPMDTSSEISTALHALGLVELSNEIFSHLPGMDLRLAREVCHHFQHVIETDPNLQDRLTTSPSHMTMMWRNNGYQAFIYNKIFLAILSTPSWTNIRENLRRHTVKVPELSGLMSYRIESFCWTDCTVNSANSLASLRADLHAISPFWRARKITREPTNTIKLVRVAPVPAASGNPTSLTLTSENLTNPEGVTVGDFVNVVERGLEWVEAAGFSADLAGVTRLKVVCMGPLMCVLVFEDEGLYHEYLMTMRPRVRWVSWIFED